MSKEQVFNSPGFFDSETFPVLQAQTSPIGMPICIIGTSRRGPAFVPITVGSFENFQSEFGTLDSKHFAPYAVDKIFTAKAGQDGAVTFVRVLGAGGNKLAADFNTTKNQGTVVNAGFTIESQAAADGFPTNFFEGAVQFLVAQHSMSFGTREANGTFWNNDSFSNLLALTNNTHQGPRAEGASLPLVRGVIFCATGTSLQITGTTTGFHNLTNATYSTQANMLFGGWSDINKDGNFKLIVSSSAGSSFGKVLHPTTNV